jgi:hypothetical protein
MKIQTISRSIGSITSSSAEKSCTFRREELHTTNRDLDRPIGSDWAGARWVHCEA